MASFILLPNGLIFCVNGANMGTAGYGNNTWAIGQSFADQPVLTPLLFNPEAPAGQQWSSNGLSASTIPRMYHSSATLLPDGMCNTVLTDYSFSLIYFVFKVLFSYLDQIQMRITTLAPV
jgi:hypothetical protein